MGPKEDQDAKKDRLRERRLSQLDRRNSAEALRLIQSVEID